jgi:hypothetical protein
MRDKRLAANPNRIESSYAKDFFGPNPVWPKSSMGWGGAKTIDKKLKKIKNFFSGGRL